MKVRDAMRCAAAKAALCVLSTSFALVAPIQVQAKTITQIIHGGLVRPQGATSVATDAAGNVYVTGYLTNNAFKITAGGVITEMIDRTGDGTGNGLADPGGIAVDADGNVYISGSNSQNAFKITPGGVISQIIDTTSGGTGKSLSFAIGIVS